MNASMPPAVAAYFSAEDAADVEVLERCFTPDAVVRDEGRVTRGFDAIKAWKSAARATYKYRIEPLSASGGGGAATIFLMGGMVIENPYCLTPDELLGMEGGEADTLADEREEVAEWYYAATTGST